MMDINHNPDQADYHTRQLIRRRTAKVNLLVYHSPEALRGAMVSFVDYYNHQALDNITPADVCYDGRRKEILARREEVKQQPLAARKVAHLSTA